MTLVDSDVLIAHLRGHDAAYEWLRRTRSHGPLFMSVVTIAEITGGMCSSERHAVAVLLSALHPVPVTDAIARRAGELQREYRRSHSGIGLGDYLIAATALTRSIPLATLNVRHFPMFPGLTAPF